MPEKPSWRRDEMYHELVIEPYDEAVNPSSFQNLSVRLDGTEVKGLQSLSLDFSLTEPNTATLEIVAGKLKVDARVRPIIEAALRNAEDVEVSGDPAKPADADLKGRSA